MKGIPIYVGLDDHHRSVQICVVRADGEARRARFRRAAFGPILAPPVGPADLVD